LPLVCPGEQTVAAAAVQVADQYRFFMVEHCLIWAACLPLVVRAAQAAALGMARSVVLVVRGIAA